MNNLRTSISLALIARRNITCVTNDYEQCVRLIVDLFKDYDDSLSWTEIDIKQDHSHFPANILYSNDQGSRLLYNIVIWKNLEAFDLEREARNRILDVFDEVEQYNSSKTKQSQTSEPIVLNGHKVHVPEIFIIIPVMVFGNTMPKINPLIKERLWFCQSVFLDETNRTCTTDWDWDLEECRNRLKDVYFDPEVREYVSSLMTFTRSHRLTSLAPASSRPTYKATVSIVELCKTLVVWNNRHDRNRPFVTPDYVKVAYRKVAYWLVDWERNDVFVNNAPGNELQRKLQISVLTGDWYGSDWHCVKSFLKEHALEKDTRTTTGFRNRLVDNVLDSVLPPL